MKAKLFYLHTGNFSADVLEGPSDPPFVPSPLWNTPLKSNPSSSVLVTIEITGEIPWGKPEPRLEFIARYKSQKRRGPDVVIRKIATIHGYGDGEKYYEGFWLYDTGCTPVRLSARIIGQRAPMVKMLNFGCGE